MVLPPVLGHDDELISLHARFRFRMALVALPDGAEALAPRLRNLLAKLEIPTRFLPTFRQLLLSAGHRRSATTAPATHATEALTPPPAPSTPALSPLAPSPAIDVLSLLSRRPARIDHDAVAKAVAGRDVLITGAGGSIGSQLAEVIAAFQPASIQLVERAENALFAVDHALARRFPRVARRAVLHDVVDARATDALLADLKPAVVFHAAAHKHVPLMEDHPAHALTNNLFGTVSIAKAAARCGVERFVMISTDKAVNPTSVMGATKRLAELFVASLAHNHRSTRFSIVRFGNVLASACSVLPIWSQQLAEGGPITVTDPRMTRYFMTIPEAAALVVQSATLAQPAGKGPVYVLDMGKPNRIIDLAVRFLRLHGFEPEINRDTIPAAALASGDARPLDLPDHEDAPDAATVPVVFTGARPGEKLFEELAYDAEQLEPTAHPAINRWTDQAPPDEQTMSDLLAELDLLRATTSGHRTTDKTETAAIARAIHAAIGRLSASTAASPRAAA
jgi:FlaA1/EpsC-like NDP-sugar epimerase